MKNTKRVLVALLSALMIFSVVGCSKETETEEVVANDTPLVVGYSNFSEKFSPFFADSAYDQDAAAVVHTTLLPSDRTGAVLLNSKDGETVAYNGTDYTYYGLANCTVTENADGTVVYDFDIRDDVTFSDGEKLTADDVIFSMYVLSDPTYDGSSTFWNLPIVGMEEYRSGMDIFYNLLIAAGEDNTDFTYWTEEQQTKFWNEAVPAAGEAFIKSIENYCLANYASYGAVDLATSLALWGYELPEGSTYADYFNTMVESYSSLDEAVSTELADSTFYSFLSSEYQAGITTGESVDSITGIEKTGDYSVRVTLSEVSAVALYQFTLAVAPLHYYGDAAKYDYANNKFGFEKGDLSSVKAVTTKPMGAGPYKFIEYTDGVIYYEANETYYLGAPKCKYMQFKEGADTDKLNGVISGTVDISDPSYSTTTEDAIRNANGGELTGDVVTTSMVDNLGYGYVGICANVVNVGGKENKGSDESKALRKALATVIANFRELTVSSYYGEFGSVINYPISNTSWAAPQSTDEGYAIAFTKDAEGNEIYTADMDADARTAAALEAALGYFEAAGCTVTDGKVTAWPADTPTSFEAWIPADGTGDHPTFMALSEASKAFETIGVTFTVKDLTNSSELWDALDAFTVAVWAAAWGAAVDPDMTQVYHSSNASQSNYYAIADDELDTLMADALKSSDQSYRKVIYKEALDIILDWAVEVPTYQRKNVVIFSTERVDIDTIAKDITPFYGWLNEVEKVALK